MMKKLILFISISAYLLICSSVFAQTTLLNFDGTANGNYPSCPLIYDGTFLYGVTEYGGTNDKGTIFKLLPDGTGYVKLLDFGGTTNGSNPVVSLMYDGTFLYGMTDYGGTNDMGTIFKLLPDGTGYVNLLDFAGTTNGHTPWGSLISDGTFLYGMTWAGGTGNQGTIFKLLPDGTGYVKLLDFAGTTNGSYPFGSLIYDGTWLYGTTESGGTNDKGTIFKIMPDGTGYSTLLNFNGTTTGRYPRGSLIYDGTFLYGMTQQGGTNNKGTIFKIMPDGTGYVKLLDFAGTTNGSYPQGSLISYGTCLYGTTGQGGTNDKGTIFKIMPNGTGYAKLSDFDGPTNGRTPNGSLISDGTCLYGMTRFGGTNNYGTVFRAACIPVTAATTADTVCAGTSITLTGGGANTYTWTGGVTNGVAFVPPVGTTIYTVTGTVTATGCTNTATRTITVNPVPTVTANASATTVCAGTTVTLTGGGANTYTWTGGVTDGAGFVPPLGTTTYTVTGTVTATGCTNTATRTITVNQPTVTANATATTVCAGASITLTGGGADTYTWTGGVTNGVAFVPPVGTTTYTVTGTVTATGCTNTATRTITVNQPTVTANATATTVCTGTSITLTGGGANTYTWTGGVTNGVAFVPPVGTTTYTVTGTVTATGCINTATRTIVVNPLPTATVSPSGPVSFCQGNTVTLLASTATSYLWSNGATSQSITVSTAGNYSVTVTDANGCNDGSPNVSLSYYQNGSSTISVIASACNGLPAVLKAVYIPNQDIATGYLWSNGATSPQIVTSTPSNYTVQVTTSNGCNVTSAPMPLPVIANCAGRLIVEADTVVNFVDTVNVRVRIENADDIFAVFAKLNFNSTYLQLISSSVGNFLGSNIINQPPIVSGGSIDFGMTKTSGQLGANGNGLIYSFAFKFNNLPVIPGNATATSTFPALFSLTNPVVNDALGAQRLVGLMPDTSLLRYYAPVWPGDLNNDYIVNVADILPIGYFYNSSGPLRPNASLQWIAQPCRYWGTNTTSPISPAYKTFADGNGNGIIDLADQTSIGFNLNQIHNKQEELDPLPVLTAMLAGVPLTVDITGAVILQTQLPTTLTIPINLGTSLVPYSNLYGVALDLYFDPAYTDFANIEIDYTNSVLGDLSTDFVAIEDNNAAAGRIGVGITRFNTTAINGQGKLFDLIVPMLSNAPYGWFNVTAVPLAANDQLGNTIDISFGADSILVDGITSNPSNFNSHNFNIYPNPSFGNLTVETETGNGIYQLHDTTGKLLLQGSLTATKFTIDISALSTGVYFFSLIDGDKMAKTKIVKK